jgi:hypothetical protein
MSSCRSKVGIVGSAAPVWMSKGMFRASASCGRILLDSRRSGRLSDTDSPPWPRQAPPNSHRPSPIPLNDPDAATTAEPRQSPAADLADAAPHDQVHPTHTLDHAARPPTRDRRRSVTASALQRSECIPLASPRKITRSSSLTFRAYAAAAGWPLVPPSQGFGETGAGTDIDLALRRRHPVHQCSRDQAGLQRGRTP